MTRTLFTCWIILLAGLCQQMAYAGGNQVCPIASESTHSVHVRLQRATRELDRMVRDYRDFRESFDPIPNRPLPARLAAYIESTERALAAQRDLVQCLHDEDQRRAAAGQRVAHRLPEPVDPSTRLADRVQIFLEADLLRRVLHLHCGQPAQVRRGPGATCRPA